MSTRSQIRFIDADNGSVAQVYKHSDGYPEGVLPLLANVRACGRPSPHYNAATFIFAGKLQMGQLNDDERYYDPEQWNDLLNDEDADIFGPRMALSYGVEDPSDGIHGDEEYLYEVETTGHGRDDWLVRIAGRGDFPRWDGLDDLDDGTTAWDVANWTTAGKLRTLLTSETDHDVPYEVHA